MNEQPEVYVATVLLEKNRWTAEKEPSYLVSDWCPKFKKAGFDGIELWENHALLAGAREQARLKKPRIPITILNSYASFDDSRQAKSSRKKSVDLIKKLDVQAVKYNFGKDQALIETYIKNLISWRNEMPDDVRLLCECHEGTVLETPDAASEVIKKLHDEEFQVIVHAFSISDKELKEWFRLLGARIAHIHVQSRNPDRSVSCLGKDLKHTENVLKYLKKNGYSGSFSIEFTEGIGPDEKIDALFESAVDDMNLVRSYFE